MQRTVAVLNQKGGVGKTTVTLGLASAADAARRRVLVVDLDPQAASSWVLGIDPGGPSSAEALASKRANTRDFVVPSAWSDHVHVLPGSADLQRLEDGHVKRLRVLLEQIEDDYEAVLVDCPPSLGDLTRSALVASAHALIVVEPSSLGLRGIGGVADVIDEIWDSHNPDLELSGVILNRVPAVSREAERRIDELARIVSRRAIWSPSIPQRVIINEAVGARRPVHSYGSRATDTAAVFDSLWRKVRGLVRS
ncbi:MAG: ParA family protein [Ilumatobacter fluminis]|uniref:ParA family protein n=1 Tax=Ilumatobacter fluminis TaxID=467091 RepID=UPI0032F00E85